ncbi:MAG: hypothetical protein Q7T57_05550 [Dehalococcoidales bacterium]|nr:hypothetical protein [Dehalococcoidales bacterium]
MIVRNLFRDPYRQIFLDYIRMPSDYLNQAKSLLTETLPHPIRLGMIGADTEIFLPNDIGGKVLTMVTASLGDQMFIQQIKTERNPLWIATEDSTVTASLGGISNGEDGALKYLALPRPWLRLTLRANQRFECVRTVFIQLLTRPAPTLMCRFVVLTHQTEPVPKPTKSQSSSAQAARNALGKSAKRIDAAASKKEDQEQEEEDAPRVRNRKVCY